ncbi:MAG: formyltransferase family protein, partial [Pseudomonadota bacterium]
MTDLPRVVVMLSGTGSNLSALADDAARHGAYAIAHVISDQPGAGGLERAASLGIESTVCPRHDGQSRAAHEVDVGRVLATLEPDVIVLAGYMRILGAEL